MASRSIKPFLFLFYFQLLYLFELVCLVVFNHSQLDWSNDLIVFLPDVSLWTGSGLIRLNLTHGETNIYGYYIVGGPLYSHNHYLPVRREPKYLCLREFHRPTLARSGRAYEMWSGGIVKPCLEVLQRENLGHNTSSFLKGNWNMPSGHLGSRVLENEGMGHMSPVLSARKRDSGGRVKAMRWPLLA